MTTLRSNRFLALLALTVSILSGPLALADPSGPGPSIVVDPQDCNKLYVNYQSLVNTSPPTSNGGGVWSSNNGGASWTQVNGPSGEHQTWEEVCKSKPNDGFTGQPFDQTVVIIPQDTPPLVSQPCEGPPPNGEPPRIQPPGGDPFTPPDGPFVFNPEHPYTPQPGDTIVITDPCHGTTVIPVDGNGPPGPLTFFPQPITGVVEQTCPPASQLEQIQDGLSAQGIEFNPNLVTFTPILGGKFNQFSIPDYNVYKPGDFPCPPCTHIPGDPFIELDQPRHVQAPGLENW